MRTAVLALLLGSASPAFAGDCDPNARVLNGRDLNAEVEGGVAAWRACINKAADFFAPQPEPVNTILVAVFATCAEQERQITHYTYDMYDKSGDRFCRVSNDLDAAERLSHAMRDQVTPGLTARILVNRRTQGVR